MVLHSHGAIEIVEVGELKKTSRVPSNLENIGIQKQILLSMDRVVIKRATKWHDRWNVN